MNNYGIALRAMIEFVALRATLYSAPLPKGGCQTPISREAADWGIFFFNLHFYLFTGPYPPVTLASSRDSPL